MKKLVKKALCVFYVCLGYLISKMRTPLVIREMLTIRCVKVPIWHKE